MTVTEPSVQQQIEELLREGREGALQRERTTFDQLVGPRGKSLVLFGAGGIGRKTLAGLRKVGIEPLAFADNNAALWGTKVNGLQVMSPREAAVRYAAAAAFVVTIWCGEGYERMGDRLRFLNSLGCTHTAPFGALYWKYSETFLPHYSAAPAHQVHDVAAEVLEAAELWADEASRQEYLSQIRWRLTFDSEGMADPVEHPIYYPPELGAILPSEVFVDCGAYDGDSLKNFLVRAQPGFQRILAFEPDPASYRKLSELVSSLPCKDAIEIHQAAVGAENGTVIFSADGSLGASTGSGSLEVKCVKLDEALRGTVPTFLKMDIEGAELDAIRGARCMIQKHAPALAICSYHTQDHVWNIPRLIHSIRPDYKFYLRPHLMEVWDVVCYAIPAHRKGDG
jgi:FkbM family methyltransferase